LAIAAWPASAEGVTSTRSLVIERELASGAAGQAGSGEARAAKLRPARLRLPRPLDRPALARRRLARYAANASARPRRLLVGVRRHRDLRPIARKLRALGSGVRPLRRLGVIAVTAAPTRVAALAARDRRIAYVEPDLRLGWRAEPDEEVDPDTGIPFGWAYDAVRAGQALAAVGGGSQRSIAVIDSGVDTGHPDLTGRVKLAFDAVRGGGNVRDHIGHGTFVTGLIAMIDGNRIGGRGVGGSTPVVAIRVGARDDPTFEAIATAIEFSILARIDILNLSLGGESFSETETRLFTDAFFADVLPVAAAGNTAEDGNPLEFPAAAIGADRGVPGIGLSVGATKPDGSPAAFSNHNRHLSIAAPGGAQDDPRYGLFSTIPRARSSWDDSDSPSEVFNPPGSPTRYAYGEGTSFATPIVAGVAALAWQAEPELASEQVAHLLMRSARQTYPTTQGLRPGASGVRSWNEFTGAGQVDALAAIALARTYDIAEPSLRARVRQPESRKVEVSVSGSDRTTDGRELAGGESYEIATARHAAGPYRLRTARSRPIRAKRLSLPASGRKLYIAASVCDANFNCAARLFGRRGR